MDNEKYGIELELITNKFKEKMQEVKSAFKGISDKKVNLNANTAQIEYLKKQIGELTADLQVNAKAKFWNESETLKAQAQLEKLTNQYNKLILKQNEVQGSSTKSSQNITKGLDKMTSKIKRFGLALLSIRSIFSLISRASSAYLAQDTELANKLQSVWAGLGALLAPIIEGIVNIFAKAVKYIAIFIKALTGVDLLARATAKSMNGTAKAAKSLNKSLAGFDDLTNLDTDAGGGTDGLGAGGFGGLEDIEIDTTWADRIEKFAKFIKDNKDAVLSFFAGIAGALIAIKLGVNGIKALGIGLLISGIVYSIQALISYFNDPSWGNFGKIIQGIGVALGGLALIIGSIPLAVTSVVVLIVGTIIKYWEQIKGFLQGGIDWLVSKTDWIGEHFGKFAQGIYEIFTSIFQFVLNIFDKIFTTIKGVFDGIIKFLKGVFTGDWKQAWEGIKDIFKSIWEGIKGIISTVWNTILKLFNAGGKIFDGIREGIVNIFKTIVNGIISGINKIITIPFNKINAVLNKIKGVNILGIKPFDGFWGWNPISVPQIPYLNVGTNYVPEDQLAMIHKGEAVVPKKFNSQEYFGGANDETNAKLDDLIEAVRNIEINPYTTIRDVGKASLNYINAKSRQLGESVVI